MPLYKCDCNETRIEVKSAKIRIVDGLGDVQDVQCAKCGSYMKLAEQKEGCAGFSSNKYGQL